MTVKHYAILIVLTSIAAAIAWDALLIAHGKLQGDSWCEACRTINRTSQGLLALGSLALWCHIFLQSFLPTDWR